MRLGNAATLMRFFDDYRLYPRREADQRWRPKMAGTTIFDEVGTFVQVPIDRRSYFLRPHIHQFFADFLRYPVVPLRLKQSQIRLRHQ